MNQEDEINESIQKLSAELDRLRKQQTYLATKRKEAEAAKAATNKLGFYAAKTCREAADVIRMTVRQIDIDKQTDQDILTSFNLINRNSWVAIKAIERDATERGEE